MQGLTHPRQAEAAPRAGSSATLQVAARNLAHDCLYSYRDTLKREEQPELRVHLPGELPAFAQSQQGAAQSGIRYHQQSEGLPLLWWRIHTTQTGDGSEGQQVVATVLTGE